jgi:hypothetical protein
MGFSSPVFVATVLPRRKPQRSDLELINSLFGPANQAGTPPVNETGTPPAAQTSTPSADNP